jgi:hypothetical protein
MSFFKLLQIQLLKTKHNFQKSFNIQAFFKLLYLPNIMTKMQTKLESMFILLLTGLF